MTTYRICTPFPKKVVRIIVSLLLSLEQFVATILLGLGGYLAPKSEQMFHVKHRVQKFGLKNGLVFLDSIKFFLCSFSYAKYFVAPLFLG